MKTIVSLLLVFCLVSCSQTQPKYASVKATTPATAAAHSETNAPAEAMAKPVDKIAPDTTLATPPSEQQGQAEQQMKNPVVLQTNTTPSPFIHPPQPPVPAAVSTPPTTPSASAVVPEPEQLVPIGSIKFKAAPLDSVLDVYAAYVGRTLLRSPTVNGQTTTITLDQQNPLTKREIVQALDAVLAMNNVAMIPIGEKFIKVVPLTDAPLVGAPISELNASMLPEFGPFDTHIVQLKFTKPSDIVPVLQQFTKTPAAVLPIEGSGMLVLRDTAENVRVMMGMIDRLDIAIPTEIESEVIPIKYALASDIANALNSLSGSGGGGGSFGGSGSAAKGSLGTSRSTGPGSARPGGNGYQGQTTSQGGISSGGMGGGGGVGGGAGGAASPSFTDRVRSLIQRAGDSGGGKGEFQILGQTKIIADERMNALLVFASKEDMAMIKKVVKQIDVVLPQVLIEAIIMEVTLDNSKTIGVSAAQNPIGNNNVGVGGFNNGQSFFPFPPSGSGSNDFPGNFTSVLPGNMLSYWGNFGGNFQVALQAAENDSRVNVLSTPRIQTSHGVEADLFVGETIPYVDSTTAGAFGGTGVFNSYQQQQIGVTLKVKPLINQDGLVVMDIYQEASEPGPASTAVNINGTAVPTINQRQASATVAVKDRDTIILGGMISTTQSKTRSGVPYLKDIPMLGALFRSTSDTGERVELIVLLRPTVLPTPEAAAMVATAERKNLPGVRRAEAEIRADEAVRMKQADEELSHVKDGKTNDIPFD